MKMSIH